MHVIRVIFSAAFGALCSDRNFCNQAAYGSVVLGGQQVLFTPGWCWFIVDQNNVHSKRETRWLANRLSCKSALLYCNTTRSHPTAPRHTDTNDQQQRH